MCEDTLNRAAQEVEDAGVGFLRSQEAVIELGCRYCAISSYEVAG